MTRPARVRLRVAGTVAVIAAVVCAWIAVRDDAPAAAVPSDDRAASTALLSARRLPYIFTEAVAAQRLAASMTDLVGGRDMCMAVANAGAADARVNGDRPLVPASTMKVLTGAGALAVLGPEHTFTTRVVAGEQGALVLVGGGDPVLSTPAYEARLRATPSTRSDPVTPLATLAGAIAATGATNIPAIVVDDTRHEAVRFLGEWDADYAGDVGALGALTVDDGSAAGARVEDPGLNAGTQLADLLRSQGVTVGAVARGVAPDGAREIASISSPPVGDLVAAMITSSDNDTAEMLTREIAVARAGNGTTAAGVQATATALSDAGVPMANVDLHDGSGLSKQNRATCDALLGALGLATDPRFAALDRGLAVAGASGTLARRLRADPLAGVLRGKTGNLDGVSGIVGVVDDPDHVRFAFLVNGSASEAAGQALQDDAARRVAAFPDAPPPDQLVPHP